MWEAMALAALAGAAALHFGWKRRYAAAQDRLAMLREEARLAREEGLRREARRQSITLAWCQHLAEGLLVLDAAGRIELVNPALERMLGLAGEIRGRTVPEVVRSPELASLVTQLPPRGRLLDHEIALAGLERRAFRVNAVALTDEAGRPEGMAFVFQDLTQLKRLENTRQEFVANVSHELRTPLSLIKGCVETLLDGAKDDPKVLQRFLATIDKHADRLMFLIEDLLILSQLESGRLALNLRPTPIREVAARVIEDLRGRAQLKAVVLENEVPTDLVAHADSERLEQVLSNLVDNAIKYGKSGGHTVIRGRSAAHGGVEVLVSDDGPGVPPDSRERIFERFYRVEKGRSREQGGTGLGLAIVKHIVQCHGGEVGLESAAGQGATFRFTLPGPEHPAVSAD